MSVQETLDRISGKTGFYTGYVIGFIIIFSIGLVILWITMEPYH